MSEETKDDGRVYLEGLGKSACNDCSRANYQVRWGASAVEVCDRHMTQLERLQEEHPDWVIGYERYGAPPGRFFYTIGCRPGWDDKGKVGDHNTPYRYPAPTSDRTYPFTAQQYARLLIRRGTYDLATEDRVA